MWIFHSSQSGPNTFLYPPLSSAGWQEDIHVQYDMDTTIENDE